MQAAAENDISSHRRTESEMSTFSPATLESRSESILKYVYYMELYSIVPNIEVCHLSV